MNTEFSRISVGPTNVTITPMKDEYQWEDVLSCNAVGNPSPSYTWRRTHKAIADGPQLALNEAGLEANRLQTIECIAQNQVFAQICLSSATIDVTISGNENFRIYEHSYCYVYRYRCLCECIDVYTYVYACMYICMYICI